MSRRQGRHPNFELCDTLIRLRDGSLSTADIEYQSRTPWRDNHENAHPANAHPDRMKLCPICLVSKPIAHFVIDGLPVRTIIRGDYALVVADVSEICDLCEVGYDVTFEEAAHA